MVVADEAAYQRLRLPRRRVFRERVGEGGVLAVDVVGASGDYGEPGPGDLVSGGVGGRGWEELVRSRAGWVDRRRRCVSRLW